MSDGAIITRDDRKAYIRDYLSHPCENHGYELVLEVLNEMIKERKDRCLQKASSLQVSGCGSSG